MKDEEIKEILGLVVLYDVCILTCFVILAISFNKWWISLFAGLFWKGFSYKSNNKEGDKNK